MGWPDRVKILHEKKLFFPRNFFHLEPFFPLFSILFHSLSFSPGFKWIVHKKSNEHTKTNYVLLPSTLASLLTTIIDATAMALANTTWHRLMNSLANLQTTRTPVECSSLIIALAAVSSSLYIERKQRNIHVWHYRLGRGSGVGCDCAMSCNCWWNRHRRDKRIMFERSIAINTNRMRILRGILAQRVNGRHCWCFLQSPICIICLQYGIFIFLRFGFQYTHSKYVENSSSFSIFRVATSATSLQLDSILWSER